MLQLIPDCKTINTRANWEAVQDAMIEHYAGWTAFKGNRNYLAMNLIPNFISRATAHSGLKVMARLQKERIGWGIVGAWFYDDTFYKPWLMSRMRDWDKLQWLKNSFDAQPTLTYRTMCTQIMSTMLRMKNEEQEIGHKLAQAIVAQMAVKGQVAMPQQSMPSDSLGLNYNANVATDNPFMTMMKTMQEQVAALAMAQQQSQQSQVRPYQQGGKPRSMSEVSCYNCRKMGHISRNCPDIRRSQDKFGSSQQQQHQQQYNKPTYRPHPQAGQQSLAGSKRTFQPSSTTLSQPYGKTARFDPATARYPERGTQRAASAAYDEGIYGHSEVASAHAAAMWEMQEEDERLEEEDVEA
jgi:hypothetical protein